jgi:hypothetical protein
MSVPSANIKRQGEMTGALVPAAAGIRRLNQTLTGYIFSFLPAQEVLRVKSVCKGFSPGFAHWERLTGKVSTIARARYGAAKEPDAAPVFRGSFGRQLVGLTVRSIEQIRTCGFRLGELSLEENVRMRDLIELFSGEKPIFPVLSELNISFWNFDDTDPQQSYINGGGRRRKGPMTPPLVDKGELLNVLKRVGFHCPKLTKLCIEKLYDRPGSTEAVDAILSGCSALVSLTLNNCRVELDKIRDKCAKAQEFRWLGNQGATEANIAACAKIPGLREIELSQPGVPLRDPVLRAFEGHPGLQTVHLVASDFTNRGLAHLVQIPNLSELEIFNCPEINDLSALAGSRSLTHLTLLTAARESAAPMLKTFPHAETLQSLTLKDSRMRDDEFQLLARYKTLRHLLIDSPCQPFSNKMLESFACCQSLVTLRLGGGDRGYPCTITTEGIIALVKALPSLRELDFSHINDNRLFDLDKVGAGIRKEVRLVKKNHAFTT